MSLTSSPTPIEYKRWKHLSKGYIVEVFEVHHHLGKKGYYTSVTVTQDGKPHLSRWPSSAFLKAFRPVGRKLKIKSAFERL
jgi:hypothetical protein